MSTNAAKTLRREVKRAKGVAAGTVVTFTRTIDFADNPNAVIQRVSTTYTARDFQYAAIFVAGFWYFTGTGRLGQSRMTNSEFIERVAQDDISDLCVVTDTEAV